MFNTTKLAIIGASVAIVYFLLKFIEMRFVDHDNQKSVKVLVRDSVVVCVSSILAVFIFCLLAFVNWYLAVISIVFFSLFYVLFYIFCVRGLWQLIAVLLNSLGLQQLYHSFQFELH